MLEDLGHKHTFSPEEFKKHVPFYNNPDHQVVVEKALAAVKLSQILVLEVSTPSVTQGYFIGKALEELKPIICFHRKESNPLFLRSFDNSLLQVVEYDNNLSRVLQTSLDYAQESLPTRYNIILSPEINNYLRWITRTYNRSRSEFIRDLIRQHMHQSEFSPTADSLEANLASEPAATPAH